MRTGTRGTGLLVVLVAGLCVAARADVVCTYSRSFNLRIPAGTGSKGWMNDAVIDVPSHLIIEDLDVSVDLTHEKAFDLQLYVESPSGSTVLLNMYDPLTEYFNGEDYQGTTFDDEAGTPIENASPPFAGRYRPLEGSLLSTFDGQDAFGDWRLSVYDAYYGHTGRFSEFALTITVPEPATIALLLLALPLLRRPSRVNGSW
jgi:subtilisin-like proprotein convertase family protein